jgi:hypothetical protein
MKRRRRKNGRWARIEIGTDRHHGERDGTLAGKGSVNGSSISVREAHVRLECGQQAAQLAPIPALVRDRVASPRVANQPKAL